MTSSRTALLLLLAAATLALLGLTGYRPYDRATWLLEVLPVLIALPLLALTWRRYPLTTLLYVCIFIHGVILMVGGMYTYARVPVGFQVAEWLHLQRNPYDKLGHLFQGFAPALIAREILLRGAYVRGRKMLFFLVTCVVLAISATYELLEWWTALAFGQGADDFLGTQGDPWDTQSDMFCALLGALLAQLGLARWQDRQITALPRPRS